MEPIQFGRISAIGTFENATKSQTTQGNSMFKDILNSVIENAQQTSDDFAKQQYMLSVGEIEDPHTVTIAATKAQISIDLMVQLRNRALESYNELMRINV